MAIAPIARRALLALAPAALAPAGCFSDRGLALQIDVAGTGATSVELFLGKTACDAGDNPAGIDCKSIAPAPAGSAPLRGTIWFRDAAAIDTVQVTSPRVAFQLRSDTAATVPIAIAVGLIQPGDRVVGVATLHDLAIPANNARVITTALVPAGAVQAAGPANAAVEDRAEVWRKAAPPSSCVVVEHWEGGAATRSFVVPGQDPDCDDVVDECNPAAYLGTGTPGEASRPDCFARQATACVLGSRACSDGSPARTGVCGPQRDAEICVPDQFCACTELGDPCWQDQIRTMPALVPFVECTITTTQLAPVTFCPGSSSAPIALDGHFAPDQTCGTPELASTALVGFNSSASFGGAQIELSSPHKPCNFSLAWKPGTPRTAAEGIDYGAIRLPTAGGALVIPLVLHFQATLDNCVTPAFSCTLRDVPADGMWSCAQ